MTIFSDEKGYSYSIIPIILKNISKRKRDITSENDDIEHHHAIFKRNGNIEFGSDYMMKDSLRQLYVTLSQLVLN